MLDSLLPKYANASQVILTSKGGLVIIRLKYQETNISNQRIVDETVATFLMPLIDAKNLTFALQAIVLKGEKK